MPRKRHQKRQSKITAPASPQQPRQFSPAAQAIAKRMASGGEEYLKENLIRVMLDSEKLAEEPEFRDLYLDDEKTTQVSERWLKKYEKRLAAAKKKGPDEAHEVADDMRIKVIADLATPAFRKNVDQRLQTLMDRLMAGKDTRKLEMVMMLIPALRMKSIPWGLCGLILEIYNRTIQRAILQFEEDRGVIDTIAEAIKAEGEDKIDIFTIFKHPDKLEQLGEKIFEAQPGLRQRAEKQVWEMVEAFEDALGRGDVELSLFSEEELQLPFRKILAEFGESLAHALPSGETQARVFEIFRQSVAEIMTPERFRRFREDVERTAKTWLSTRQKWAPALQFELSYLDGDQYEENKFIMGAYFGQISRLGKQRKSATKTKKTRLRKNR